MDLQNIQDQLNTEFAKSETRVMFWFDDKGEYEDEVSELQLGDVKLHILDGTNWLYTKYLLNEEDKESKYLVYAAFAKPSDAENPLGDNEKYFKSLDDNGLTEKFWELCEKFFGYKSEKSFLYYQLKMSMLKADRIDIIVSFMMESGVRMILKDLKSALDRGVQIRVLTGNYLGITQPSALYLIKKELGNRVDLRFYNDKGRSFHPKSYIFHYEDSEEIYIGSSNISKSALTSGIEWNYRFNSFYDKENFDLFYDTFVDLFENHSIVIDDRELTKYSKNWHKPAVSKDLAKYDDLEDNADTKVEVLFQPRGAQIEALYALKDSRSEGATKGLVQAATGYCVISGIWAEEKIVNWYNWEKCYQKL